MKVLLSVLLSAVVVSVFATHCHHDDATPCMGALTCADANEEPACEHDVCTCVPKPPGQGNNTCADKADCISFTCSKHDELPHCVDRSCACLKLHH